jgi:hydrogenase maturation factor
MVTENGDLLKEELEKSGIRAEIIGKLTASNDRVVIKGEERRFLEPPKSDDIVKGWNYD